MHCMVDKGGCDAARESVEPRAKDDGSRGFADRGGAIYELYEVIYICKQYGKVYIGDMAEIIIREVDEKLRNSFKAWCVERGSTMKAELIRYMQRIVEERKKGK
jgi:hypothetical protein